MAMNPFTQYLPRTPPVYPTTAQDTRLRMTEEAIIDAANGRLAGYSVVLGAQQQQAKTPPTTKERRAVLLLLK